MQLFFLRDSMLILGLSSFKHNTAAALFEDGIIKAAIEEIDSPAQAAKGSVPEPRLVWASFVHAV